MQNNVSEEKNILKYAKTAKPNATTEHSIWENNLLNQHRIVFFMLLCYAFLNVAYLMIYYYVL